MKMPAFLVLLSLSFALLSACSSSNADDYKNGDRETEILDLLNDRDYERAIFLIESRDGKKPGSPKRALLLAEAYLGKAGFEPLAVAGRVSGPQSALPQEAQEIFPHCPNGALRPDSGEHPNCLLKRVYFSVPDPDDRNLARARDLLRAAYPDASQTAAWVNVLAGSVELASCSKRFLQLELALQNWLRQKHQPRPEEWEWLNTQGEKALREASEALARAHHAGEAVSKLLTGQKNSPWFSEQNGRATFLQGLAVKKGMEYFATDSHATARSLPSSLIQEEADQ